MVLFSQGSACCTAQLWAMLPQAFTMHLPSMEATLSAVARVQRAIPSHGLRGARGGDRKAAWVPHQHSQLRRGAQHRPRRCAVLSRVQAASIASPCCPLLAVQSPSTPTPRSSPLLPSDSAHLHYCCARHRARCSSWHRAHTWPCHGAGVATVGDNFWQHHLTAILVMPYVALVWWQQRRADVWPPWWCSRLHHACKSCLHNVEPAVVMKLMQ